MKKSLLIVGISMDIGGTEKAFLAFLRSLDSAEFDVTLLLCAGGALESEIPDWVNIIYMERYGGMFTLRNENAAKEIAGAFVRQNPLVLFRILPYWLRMKLHPQKKHLIAMRLWCALMKGVRGPEKKYDICCAYWGDKTMFYAVDCVKADKKIAWMHFDYNNPEREDALYRRYFGECDAVVSVSEQINDEMKRRFPELSQRFHVIANTQDTALLRTLAHDGGGFTDEYSGARILTVGRVSPEKGIDLGIEAMAILASGGVDLRYYVIGPVSDDTRRELTCKAEELGIGGRVFFLGAMVNPYGYMSGCTLYLQPSRFEGRPIAVDEALSLLRPCVVTDYVSSDAQMDGGRYGVICRPTPPDIAQACGGLLCDTARYSAVIAALNERLALLENGVKKSAGEAFANLCV